MRYFATNIKKTATAIHSKLILLSSYLILHAPHKKNKMRKIICLLFSFALSTFAIKAQTQLTQVDMSKYGLPFTWELPVSKTQTLNVQSEKDEDGGTNVTYAISIGKEKKFYMALFEFDLKPEASSIEERIKALKSSAKQSKAYKFERFIVDEPTLFLEEYKKPDQENMTYTFQAMARSTTKHYQFTTRGTREFTEADCKVMVDAIKSIKFK